MAFWCTAVGLRLEIILISKAFNTYPHEQRRSISSWAEQGRLPGLPGEPFAKNDHALHASCDIGGKIIATEIMPRIFISMAGVPARRATILLWFWSIASIEQSRLLCHTGSSLKNNHPCHFLYAAHTHIYVDLLAPPWSLILLLNVNIISTVRCSQSSPWQISNPNPNPIHI